MKRRATPDWLTRWEYAHRGLHGAGVPENSLAAAEAAMAAGLGIECDIQRSADGHALVFHDWELERLTTGQGALDAFRIEEIELLSYRETDHRPARLATLLGLVAGRVPLLIEIKSRPGYDVERTCEHVAGQLHGYAGDHAVMSFDPVVPVWMREHAGHVPCGLVMREDAYGYTQTQAEREAAVERAAPDFLAYHIAALPNPWVAGLRKGGLPILTWTVDTPELRERAQACADALVCEADGFA
ncbi:MAG: glycerophosphodiester phosphodiesterase family protein [Erythrobacter sp.]|uniref:glycerophosphodiester phosphodiesterase family protein n=1 Tax=Erythrobacter sp. TaxID=1042 RepID=UPI003C718A0D